MPGSANLLREMTWVELMTIIIVVLAGRKPLSTAGPLSTIQGARELNYLLHFNSPVTDVAFSGAKRRYI